MSVQSEYMKICDKWRKKNISDEYDLDVVLNNFRILFAYNSNVIENPKTNYHDTREIFENGKVCGYTGDLRTLFEIQNQKECYEYLKPLIIECEKLSSHLICEIHQKLMNGCYDEARYAKGERPGTFKVHDYITGDDVGALPEDVPSAIAELCDEVNAYDGENVSTLRIGAYLHMQFEAIHPFADGNGRVGRTLMNYYFMTHGHPPVIIYEDEKQTYYAALAVFDKTGELSGFEQFLKEQVVRTWERHPQKIRKLKSYLSAESEI